jgi:hypothetical protein
LMRWPSAPSARQPSGDSNPARADITAMIVPQRFARLAKRVEEVAALLDCGPLRLTALVVGDDDVEAVKARVLAAHLAAHPQDARRPVEWETIHVNFVQPPEIEAPRDREVHYTTADGALTLTDAAGEPIEIGGRRFARPLGPNDDEVTVAEQLAREAFP